MMSQQQERRIVTEILDQPHIKDRRVTVLTVSDLVNERGLAPEAVADQLEVDLADVYRALAYYHDNPTEMEAVRERRTEQFAAFEDREHLPDHVDLGAE